tara:strand:+ start:90 stop:539 length:450 start_codon:yes stop_codon:yes gene_type:complete
MNLLDLLNLINKLDEAENLLNLKNLTNYYANILLKFEEINKEINEAKYLANFKKRKYINESEDNCNLKRKKINIKPIGQIKCERYLLINHAANCKSDKCKVDGCKYFRYFLINHCRYCCNQNCKIPFCASTRLIVNEFAEYIRCRKEYI